MSKNTLGEEFETVLWAMTSAVITDEASSMKSRQTELIEEAMNEFDQALASERESLIGEVMEKLKKREIASFIRSDYGTEFNKGFRRGIEAAKNESLATLKQNKS